MNRNYYDCDPLPEVVTATYWSEDVADYGVYQNLIAGFPQKIEAEFPIPDSHQTEYFNTPVSFPRLTDGIKGGLDYLDPAWHHALGGLARTIYYDLIHTSEITGFTVGFLNSPSLWIHPPKSMRFEASEDGKEWEILSRKSIEYDRGTNARVQVDVTFDKPRKARFVRLYFPIGPHLYIDEIEVFGTKKISENAISIVPSPSEVKVFPNKFASPDELDGINNIVLTYTCAYPETRRGRHSVEDLLPFVGYYNKEGKLTDTFFDSYLFLPCTSRAPSGAAMQAGNLIFSDWQYYIDDQYAEGTNIPGLEKTVEIVGNELGIKDLQVNVFLSILRPMTGQRDFGDIDGSGVSLDFANPEHRKKAVKWEIDEQLRRFNESGFKHLKLWGFYWYEESIDGDDEVEMELLRYTNEYVRSLGYKSIWIPYYQAQGFNRWSEFGFDTACLQPNYMFNKDAKESRVYECAELAKMLGMCVEMEIDGRSITQPEWRARYIAYLRGGVKTGYMKDGIKMYYQDGSPGVFYNCFVSQDPLVRAVYDNTYLFSKNRLTEEIIDKTMV
ncbi:MAG: DUF4855 domain-containing protein [Eubacteriales bacterium]|nr:DUF4855 domain-containing protein [Eubacteriales bacterium]MDD4475825.1 DUF4855 domain-containing protein [Eubacteriales bacterium]